MDFIFLPAKIKSVLESLAPGKSPISLVRSNGNLEGSPGEGYVVAYEDKVFLFSKAMGEDGFQKMEASYGDGVSGVSIRKEKFNSFLDMNVGGKSFSVKFSSFEEGDLKPMLEKCGTGAAVQGSPADMKETSPVAQEAKESAIAPMTGFAAAMMYIAATDNEIVKEENDYIRKACFNDNDIIKAGYEYYQNNSYEDLLGEFSSLDRQQALCIMANLIELAMSDGVLHRDQQEMIWKFAKAAGVSGDYEKFREILLIKNQTTALCN